VVKCSFAKPTMNPRDRASWDQYFMRIALEVATRATCDRKHVGAVIVRDKNILATGYNGSIRGLSHCDEEGHMMEDGHCVRTIHAEANAIIQAAKNGMRIEGGSIYVSASPCWGCFKMIANAGLLKIAYGEFYRDQRIFEFAQKLGIELVKVEIGELST
jgi:dCMP deaminase